MVRRFWPVGRRKLRLRRLRSPTSSNCPWTAQQSETIVQFSDGNTHDTLAIRRSNVKVVQFSDPASGIAFEPPASITVENITPFLPGDTIAYLRLADGERRFPFRPISSSLFLIGQGPGCDLRLGLPEMPAIHSAIQIHKGMAEIVRIASDPELLVNGDPVSKCKLQEGDLIEIGDVRLAYFPCSAAGSIAAEKPADLKSMNALELVDGMQSDLRLISSEASGTSRLGDLLKAAQQAVDACHFADTIRFSDYVTDSAESEGDHVDRLQEQSVSRLTAIETRLDEICHVLEQVVNQQQLIATALQCVAERIDDLRANPQSGSLRASA